MEDTVGAVVGIVLGIISLAIIVLTIMGLWKVFAKAGQPGWASLIPIYNGIVLLQIVGKPLWWIILMLIPFVSLVVCVLVSIALSERFGKSTGFGVGLFFLPFVFCPILGFGDAQYSASPATAEASTS